MTDWKKAEDRFWAAVALLALLIALSNIAHAQPAIDWLGCGPSWNGSRVGASCAFTVAVAKTQGLDSYTVLDASWAHGKTANTLSSGIVLDARQYKFGKATLHLNLLGAPGVTQTPSATSFSAIYGVHPAMEWRGFTFGAGWRGATGDAARRLWNASLGFSFGAGK